MRWTSWPRQSWDQLSGSLGPLQFRAICTKMKPEMLQPPPPPPFSPSFLYIQSLLETLTLKTYSWKRPCPSPNTMRHTHTVQMAKPKSREGRQLHRMSWQVVSCWLTLRVCSWVLSVITHSSHPAEGGSWRDLGVMSMLHREWAEAQKLSCPGHSLTE